MQKIIPFLWFDDKAEEATNFYVSTFKNGELLSIGLWGEAGPGLAGTVRETSFRLAGLEFGSVNGGPMYKLTPAISFFVSCQDEQETDDLWSKLSQNGTVLMELGNYPFSDKFGWVADQYGVSWQVSLAGVPQTISPFLMFVGAQHGRAVEAINFYSGTFENSKIDQVDRYASGENEPEGTVRVASFLLNGQSFMAIDSNAPHNFTFTPAVSFLINCGSQDEVDALWVKLSDGGETIQCGWLNDKFGVTWQVVPTVLIEMMRDTDPEKSNRLMEAMFPMIKLDIAALERAYKGIQ